MTSIGNKPLSRDVFSFDSSLLGFNTFSSTKNENFWPKSKINIKESNTFNPESSYSTKFENNDNTAVSNEISQFCAYGFSVPAPNCCLKPNTFNSFKFGSQLSVENCLLNTSLISEVNKNVGTTNGFDNTTFTPCMTQELVNI